MTATTLRLTRRGKIAAWSLLVIVSLAFGMFFPWDSLPWAPEPQVCTQDISASGQTYLCVPANEKGR